MSEIDRDYTTDPAFATVNLNIPPAGIDLRIILRALRYELLNYKLGFSNKPEYRHHIIIPTLRKKFRTKYKDGYIEIRRRCYMIRIPAEIENDVISDRTIDIMCAYLESWKINGEKVL